MEPNPKEIKSIYDTKEAYQQNNFDIPMKILCKCCGAEIIIKYKTKKPRNFCSNYCSIKWNRTIHKNKSNKLKLNQVNEFLDEMKSKHHWADMIDIFKMIDIWDLIEPGKQVPDDEDRELVFSKIYYRIIKWKIKTESNKKSEYNKKYYQENKKRLDNKSREYQQANRERLREWGKQYREANKEKIKEYQKEYYRRKWSGKK